MSEMLERAARALADSDGQRFKLGSLYDRNPDLYLRLARAVLMAVREIPAATQAAIFDARDGFVHEIDIPAVWQLGIDAILNDGGDQ